MVILRFLNSLPVFWIILSLPAVALVWRFGSGAMIAMDLLHPTGEFSARFMIIAMLVTPLATIFGNRRWIMWLMRRRRAFGLAAFGYAMLHLVFYVIDMETIASMLAEIDAPGIWTGWLALLLFVPLAITSSNAAMRALGKRWKTLPRLISFASSLTLAHWLLIHDGVGGALVHFIPFAAIQLLRMIINYSRSKAESQSTELSI